MLGGGGGGGRLVLTWLFLWDEYQLVSEGVRSLSGGGSTAADTTVKCFDFREPDYSRARGLYCPSI